MTNVVPLFQSFEDIHVPAPLRDMPNWLCWKRELLHGGTRPEKVPHYPSGERRKGPQGGVAGVYQRHDWADEKRAALAALAGRVERLTKGIMDTNVVRMEGGR